MCYKFGYNLEYVCGLTIPQIKILESNLSKILKAENGTDKSSNTNAVPDSNSVDDNKNKANRLAFGDTVRMLKKKTGKESITLAEMMDPAGTIDKYRKLEV